MSRGRIQQRYLKQNFEGLLLNPCRLSHAIDFAVDRHELNMTDDAASSPGQLDMGGVNDLRQVRQDCIESSSTQNLYDAVS